MAVSLASDDQQGQDPEREQVRISVLFFTFSLTLARSRQFARDAEWNYSDMLKHTSFGRFLKDKLLERENIDDDGLYNLYKHNTH